MSKFNKVWCFFGFHNWELQENEYRGIYAVYSQSIKPL